MDIGEFKTKFTKPVKNKHLHTPSHLLAEELATKLNDRKHFGYFLKMTYTHNHDVLRRILGEVLENPKVDNKGRLFTYLLSKLKDNKTL